MIKKFKTLISAPPPNKRHPRIVAPLGSLKLNKRPATIREGTVDYFVICMHNNYNRGQIISQTAVKIHKWNLNCVGPCLRDWINGIDNINYHI